MEILIQHRCEIVLRRVCVDLAPIVQRRDFLQQSAALWLVVQAAKPERDHDRCADKRRIVDLQLRAKTSESAKCAGSRRAKRKFRQLVDYVSWIGVAVIVIGIQCLLNRFDCPCHRAMFVMGLVLDGTDAAPVHTPVQFGLDCKGQQAVGSLGQSGKTRRIEAFPKNLTNLDKQFSIQWRCDVSTLIRARAFMRSNLRQRIGNR